MTSAEDERWLDAAARLSRRGRPASFPNPSVGCLVVNDGHVVGRGWTNGGGRPHAEAVALEQAGALARGSCVYVTLEPCAHTSPRGPSCAALLAAARPARVVIGHSDPDPRTSGAGETMLKKAGIAVARSTGGTSAESLAGYLTRVQLGRPHVTLKLAMSLDGCIALASGESQWITGEEARAHVHSRRAMADAILVGGGTWRADKPQLGVRLPGLQDRSPKRVLLTRGIPPDGVKVINTPGRIRELDALYLYVEAGAETAASFLAADLVDRLEIYRAPIIIGGGKSSVGDTGLETLAPAHGRWALEVRRQLGSDTYEAYSRTR